MASGPVGEARVVAHVGLKLTGCAVLVERLVGSVRGERMRMRR